MADKGGADKSEKPTPKRLKEGRKQGQVARSPDLAAWSPIVVLSYVIPGTVSGVHDAVTGWLDGLDDVMKTPDMTQVLTSIASLVKDAGMATLPLLLVAMLVSIVAGVAQGGARPYFSRLKPKFSRMRSESPLPVTTPMRADISCTTMSATVMGTRVQRSPYP